MADMDGPDLWATSEPSQDGKQPPLENPPATATAFSEAQHADTPRTRARTGPSAELWITESGAVLSELLLRWEELRQRGESISAEELCRDFPGQLAEIRKRIDALQAVCKVLDSASRDDLKPEQAAPDQWPEVPGYEILGELGRGGMGVVYKARQKKANRIVALKMLLAGEYAGAEQLARFRGEAEKTARLQHPHIVQIFDVNEHEGRPYFSLEYVEGGSLAHKLSGTPQPARQAAELVETLSRAMYAAHQAGIIHRDLKPANVLLTVDGTPKITDFGLAKRLDAETQHTRSGAVMGTPSYMAPEQASGKIKAIGPAVDVYALGAILYEMLTGRPPFKGESVWDTVQQVLAENPVPPRRLQSKVPRDLDTICLKCLQKDPRKRYPSAEALADDLRRYQEGRPILARHVGGGEKLWRWCRRNPVVATLTTAVAILLVAGTGISMYFAVQAIQERTRADQRAEDYRKQLYVSNVNRALGEWQNNNLSLAERLLEVCPEDLRGWEWRYAKRLCYQDRLTIYRYFAPGPNWYAHNAHHTIAFSPDSRWVAAEDWDHLVKLWDTATGTQVRAMQGEASVVFSLAFSPDGKLLASGNSDHTVRIWNAETGELLHTLRGHTFIVFQVHVPTDGRRIISASPVLVQNKEWLSHMEIIVWDIVTGRPLSRTVVAEANILWGGIAFSPDGTKFIAAGNQAPPVLVPSIVGLLGSALGQGPFLAVTTLRRGRPGDDFAVVIGNTDTGQCVQTLYTEWACSFAFHPDGNVVATTGMETIWLWEAATGKGIRSLEGHASPVKSLAFSPDGTRLASGSEDSTVRLWDTRTGKQIASLRGNTQGVQSVAFSPDDRWVASAGRDGTVRLCDALDPAEPVTLRGSSGKYLSDLNFSPDGQRLYSFSGHSTNGTPDGIKCWDWHSAKQLLTFPDSEGWSTGMAMSPDGKCIASADKDGTITWWDAANGHRLHRWAARAGPIHSLAFSPDGKVLAYASDNEVIALDAQTRQKIRTFPGAGGALYSLTFSPDSRRIGAVAQDQVLVWDWAKGQLLFSFPANTFDHRMYHFAPILAFSVDGKLAVPDMNRISIRDALTGREILNLPGHSGRVVCLAFTPDGKRLASGSSSDYDVKLWDTTTGQEVLVLRGHTNVILSLAFSPDGELLATSSIGEAVKLWNAAGVPPDRVFQRYANNWVQASFDKVIGVPDKPPLRDLDNLVEPARPFALQMAKHRVEQFGRIPAYHSWLGNELWSKHWRPFARRRFTEAEIGFRTNVALNPGKARAHGDFAFFLVTCPEPQVRDAAKALAYAQKAVTLDPANADYAALLGMAQYRKGQWQAAVDTLEKAIGRGAARYLGHAKLFLSLAHKQLGHTTEANRWFHQALTEMKEDASREELSHLRAEAAAVLGLREYSSEPERKLQN